MKKREGNTNEDIWDMRKEIVKPKTGETQTEEGDRAT